MSDSCSIDTPSRDYTHVPPYKFQNSHDISSRIVTTVDEGRVHFPPFPSPRVQVDPDLQHFVFGPINKLKLASHDRDGQLNPAFDIEVAVTSVVAFVPAAAAANPAAAAAAPSIVVV